MMAPIPMNNKFVMPTLIDFRKPMKWPGFHTKKMENGSREKNKPTAGSNLPSGSASHKDIASFQGMAAYK